MECLKLTSIRLSKASLNKASELARTLGYYQTAQVIRIAIWIGLKCITPGVLFKLSHLMWEEEERDRSVTLEDVLHTAGLTQDSNQGAEV